MACRGGLVVVQAQWIVRLTLSPISALANSMSGRRIIDRVATEDEQRLDHAGFMSSTSSRSEPT